MIFQDSKPASGGLAVHLKTLRWQVVTHRLRTTGLLCVPIRSVLLLTVVFSGNSESEFYLPILPMEIFF